MRCLFVSRVQPPNLTSQDCAAGVGGPNLATKPLLMLYVYIYSPPLSLSIYLRTSNNQALHAAEHTFAALPSGFPILLHLFTHDVAGQKTSRYTWPGPATPFWPPHNKQPSRVEHSLLSISQAAAALCALAITLSSFCCCFLRLNWPGL